MGYRKHISVVIIIIGFLLILFALTSRYYLSDIFGNKDISNDKPHTIRGIYYTDKVISSDTEEAKLILSKPYIGNLVADEASEPEPDPDPEPEDNPIEKYKLNDAYISYEVPVEMYVGEKYSVNTLISKSDILVDYFKNKQKTTVDSTIEIFELDTISLSPAVKVELHDPQDAFLITPLQDKEYMYVGDSITGWQWSVVPEKSGNKSLIIKVTTKVFNGIEDSYFPHRPFEKEIVVKITFIKSAATIISKHWQWVIGTLLIPFGVFLYNKKNNKGKKGK